MTPGLARGPPFPLAANKGSVVAIASLDTPSVPMVVGVCEINVNELKAVTGEKGRAVRGVHWDGDELWAWSAGGKGGGNRPTTLEGWDVKNEAEIRDLKDEVNNLQIDDAEADTEEGGGVLLEGVTGDKLDRGESSGMGGTLSPGDNQLEDKELSTKGSLIGYSLRWGIDVRIQKSMRRLKKHFYLDCINTSRPTEANRGMGLVFP
jgi:translation initiation factor 2D